MYLFSKMVSVCARKRTWLPLAVLILTLGFHCENSVAADGDFNSFSYGGWQGHMGRDARTGAFQYCAIKATFDSNTTLYFFMREDFELDLVLKNPAWSLSAEDSAPVSFEVDGRLIQHGPATSTRPTSARFSFDETSFALYWLRRGRALDVIAAGDDMRFSLKGSNGALDLLLKCVASGTGIQLGSSDPFAASKDSSADPRDPFAKRTTSPEDGEMRRAITSWLNTAGFRDWQFVDSDGALLAWNAEGLSGFMIRLEVSGRTHKQIFDSIMGAADEYCEDEYAYALTAPVRVDDFVLREAAITCPTDFGSLGINLVIAFFDNGQALAFHHTIGTMAADENSKALANLQAVLAKGLAIN